MRRRFLLITFAIILGLGCLGIVWPENAVIPVEGASRNDWHPKSFWYEPWGVSGVHKGIDIFAAHGTNVFSAVPGVVVYQGLMGKGGNVVVVLSPKWRLHYYAHLADPVEPAPFFVGRGTRIGAVGNSGNAAGKPPHLHYAVLSLLPLPWRYSSATEGWKQMFILDPNAILEEGA
ncbi:MAG: M23 family metallopeptidase [Gammaproteobacteria bacterium]